MAFVKQYVRIHPLTKGTKGGHRVQRYSIYGTLFQESVGWYICSFTEEQWDYLRNVRTNTEDPDSKPVFEVCTATEKAEIERRAQQVRVTEVAPEPVDLTTKDLRAVDFTEAEKRARPAPAPAAPAPAPAPAAPDVAEEEVGIAPPVTAPAAATKRRGRPRKVVSTTEG
jgi:hypothetical protein